MLSNMIFAFLFRKFCPLPLIFYEDARGIVSEVLISFYRRSFELAVVARDHWIYTIDFDYGWRNNRTAHIEQKADEI